jgi:hypothetical protein
MPSKISGRNHSHPKSFVCLHFAPALRYEKVALDEIRPAWARLPISPCTFSPYISVSVDTKMLPETSSDGARSGKTTGIKFRLFVKINPDHKFWRGVRGASPRHMRPNWEKYFEIHIENLPKPYPNARIQPTFDHFPYMESHEYSLDQSQVASTFRFLSRPTCQVTIEDFCWFYGFSVHNWWWGHFAKCSLDCLHHPQTWQTD